MVVGRVDWSWDQNQRDGDMENELEFSGFRSEISRREPYTCSRHAGNTMNERKARQQRYTLGQIGGITGIDIVIDMVLLRREFAGIQA